MEVGRDTSASESINHGGISLKLSGKMAPKTSILCTEKGAPKT